MKIPSIVNTQKKSAFILICFALIGLCALAAEAQQTRRIKFSRNVKKIVLNDSANRKQTDVYIFRLKKGERADALVTWKGRNIGVKNEDVLSGFSIHYPSGEKAEDPQDGVMTATKTGDYKVLVTPRHRKTNYRYKITFTKLD